MNATTALGSRWGADAGRLAPLSFALWLAILSSTAGAQVDTWVQVASSGPPPSTSGAMAYDSIRGRTVLVTGIDQSGVWSSTWEWDGVSWALRVPCPPCTAPSSAYGAAMAFDSRRGRVVRAGGSTASETWEWDGSSWLLRALTGPASRGGNNLQYDASRGVMVMFGLSQGSPQVDETWTWDGTSWTLRLGVGGPLWLGGHAMAYDSNRGRMVLFSGADLANSYRPETWEWDGVSWQQVANSGPLPRVEHAMTYDSRRRRVVLFGGQHWNPVNQIVTYFSDMWEWDGQVWTQSSILTPPARLSHSMVFDEQRGRIVLFGGQVTSSTGQLRYFGDTWELVRPSVVATSTPFGVGCGVPALSITTGPRSSSIIGTSVIADITGVPGSIVAMAVGGSAANTGPFLLPINLALVGMPGCWQYHDASLGLFFPCSAPVAGASQCILAVPSDPGLLGLHAYLQAWAGDPGRNALGIVTSNAIDIVVGNLP